MDVGRGVGFGCRPDCRVLRERPATVAAVFGLESDGAALVRSDGIIAWRTRDVPDDPASEVADVVGRLLSRPALVRG